MSKIKSMSLVFYIIISVFVFVGLMYFGATQTLEFRQQNAAARSLENKVDVIRNILGSAPGASGEDVLNKIISRFSQPRIISPPQMARMSHDIAFLKDILPKIVLIARSIPGGQNGEDFQLWNPLNEMFLRNGFRVDQEYYKPASIDETGLMLIVSDPMHPPEYIQRLQDAFNLAGISNIRLVNIDSLYNPERITILIGPAPI